MAARTRVPDFTRLPSIRRQRAAQALLALTGDLADAFGDRHCVLRLISYVAGLEAGHDCHSASELEEIAISARLLISGDAAGALFDYLASIDGGR